MGTIFGAEHRQKVEKGKAAKRGSKIIAKISRARPVKPENNPKLVTTDKISEGEGGCETGFVNKIKRRGSKKESPGHKCGNDQRGEGQLEMNQHGKKMNQKSARIACEREHRIVTRRDQHRGTGPGKGEEEGEKLEKKKEVPINWEESISGQRKLRENLHTIRN